MKTNDAVLCLKDVSYVYDPGTPFEKRALSDINIEIRKGSLTGLIGHTGSGKSTLLQLLNGLEKPTSGKIYLNGQNIWEKPKEIRSVRFRVGLVMQYPEYQLFEETVRKDIGYGPRNMGLPEKEIEERVLEAAAFVHLDPLLLDQSPFDLSGGQKRRAAIAGIIAMRPEVLVLDEPAAGLDPLGRDIIFSGIREYRNCTGATVVIVSHSMEDMANLCEDLIVLSDGKVLMTGTPAEIFRRGNELSEVGLNVPEVTRVMLLLKERGIPVSTGVFTVDAALKEILKQI